MRARSPEKSEPQIDTDEHGCEADAILATKALKVGASSKSEYPANFIFVYLRSSGYSLPPHSSIPQAPATDTCICLDNYVSLLIVGSCGEM